MSTLKVNNIDTQTGTTISVASGKVLTASGHIIQTVIGDKFTTQTTTTSTSYSDVVSLAITPKFSSSSIKVSLSIASGNHSMRLLRDSTALFTPTNTYMLYDNDSYANQVTTTQGSHRRVLSWSFVDSPSTTSAITYKWQVASYNASNGTGMIFNELTATTASNYTYMEIMEIAQ